MSTRPEIEARLKEQRQALKDVLGTSYMPVGHANASEQHRQLFESYVAALQSAKAEAEEWWNALISAWTERLKDPVRARAYVEEGHPAGSVAHGAVVHAFRQAWVGCVDLNETTSNTHRVEPFEL